MASWAHDAGVRCTRRQVAGIDKRTLGNALISAGLAADGRSRWAVADILAWRGRGRRREALVRWEGFQAETDLFPGEPWPDSWEPRSNLTGDLRKLGAARHATTTGRRTAAEAAEEESAVEGKRKSPRLAGDAPMAGIAMEGRRRGAAAGNVSTVAVRTTASSGRRRSGRVAASRRERWKRAERVGREETGRPRGTDMTLNLLPRFKHAVVRVLRGEHSVLACLAVALATY